MRLMSKNRVKNGSQTTSPALMSTDIHLLVKQKELTSLTYYFSLPYHIKQMIIFK